MRGVGRDHVLEAVLALEAPADGLRLELPAHGEQVEEALVVESDDGAAAGRGDLDEALRVELVQRGAHGPAADPERARDRRLHERRAGRHATPDTIASRSACTTRSEWALRESLPSDGRLASPILSLTAAALPSLLRRGQSSKRALRLSRRGECIEPNAAAGKRVA